VGRVSTIEAQVVFAASAVEVGTATAAATVVRFTQHSLLVLRCIKNLSIGNLANV
jgi:hypothetical protein